MGRKVHPMGFRVGIINDWQARWYADKSYAECLQEDIKLRKAIDTKYLDAGIAMTEIERQANEVTVTIHTARPGIVIGRGGQRVDEMRAYLEQLIGRKIRVNIREIQQPELNAFLVAKSLADQLSRRIAHRRAMKQAMFRTMQAGAKGIRISCAGRLGGTEIARRETMHEGRVPLHTIRADIDYGFTEARTGLGRIGVKVWLYKGDILPERDEMEIEDMPEEVVSEITDTAGTMEPELAVTAIEDAKQPALVAEAMAKEAEAPVIATEAAIEEIEAPAAVEKSAAPRKRATAKVTEVATKETAKAKKPPVVKKAKTAKTEITTAEKPAVTRKKTTAKTAEATTKETAKAKKPVATKKTKAAGTEAEVEKPTKPNVKARAKTTPVKTARKSKVSEPTNETGNEPEVKDAATETGEAPQDS